MPQGINTKHVLHPSKMQVMPWHIPVAFLAQDGKYTAQNIQLLKVFV